jgi:hypothetical protein
MVLAAIAVCLAVVSCDEAFKPTQSTASASAKLSHFTVDDLPGLEYGPPPGLVTVEFGGQSETFWPFTGDDFSGQGKDPINLIFVGKADPRDIRAALLSLDGDRTAFGFPDAPPWNARWDDAIGDVQTGYGQSDGWTGGAVQLACGDYGPIRYHLRLFKVGQWTVGNAHFETLIEGTADHQVLSWDVAEDLVTADMVRSGLLDPEVPMGVSQYINQEPFRTIPAMIYNELPLELRQFIGGPLDDVTYDVEMSTDGIATIFNLAGQAERVAEVRYQDLVIEYGQYIPKPFCSSGPNDWVYVEGPVNLYQTAELTEDGNYIMTFRAEGELTVVPIDMSTGQVVGEPMHAVVKEHHDARYSDNVCAAWSLLHQNIVPASSDHAGSILKRLRVSSAGGDAFQVLLHCPDMDDYVDVTNADACQPDLTEAAGETADR